MLSHGRNCDCQSDSMPGFGLNRQLSLQNSDLLTNRRESQPSVAPVAINSLKAASVVFDQQLDMVQVPD